MYSTELAKLKILTGKDLGFIYENDKIRMYSSMETTNRDYIILNNDGKILYKNFKLQRYSTEHLIGCITGAYGVLNNSGELEIDFKYTRIFNYMSNWAWVKSIGGAKIVVNKQDNLLMDIDICFADFFKNNVGVFSPKNNSRGFIVNTEGFVLNTFNRPFISAYLDERGYSYFKEEAPRISIKIFDNTGRYISDMSYTNIYKSNNVYKVFTNDTKRSPMFIRTYACYTKDFKLIEENSDTASIVLDNEYMVILKNSKIVVYKCGKFLYEQENIEHIIYMNKLDKGVLRGYIDIFEKRLIKLYKVTDKELKQLSDEHFNDITTDGSYFIKRSMNVNVLMDKNLNVIERADYICSIYTNAFLLVNKDKRRILYFGDNEISDTKNNE